MKIKKLFDKFPFLGPSLILIIGFAIYYQSTGFEFLINFDDDTLILNSPELNAFNWENIIYILSHPKDGLYHPITSLTWLIENSLFGLDPFWFHLNNVLFHLGIGLVFYQFVKKYFDNHKLALICLALFILHPMHVENVAWIAGRKDLVFGLFFMLSLLYYTKFQHKNRKSDYAIAILFFVLSLLSKINAAVLPAIFILMDWHKNKLSLKKSFIRQLPSFLIGFLLVIYTIYLQKTAGFINEANPAYDLIDRFFMLNYSISYYLWHIIIPLPLAPKNLYPTLENGLLSWEYYASFFFLIGMVYLVLKSKFKKDLILALGAFLLVLLPVLKILPTGNDLVSNRYAYMAYPFIYAVIGLMLISSKKNFLKIAFGLWLLAIGYISFSYQSVYQSSVSVWTAVIESSAENPWGQAMAYNERGQVKLKKGLQDAAFSDINKALNLQPDLRRALMNRANIYERNQKTLEALNDINNVLAQNENDVEALKIRSVLLAKNGETENAINDLKKAIDLQAERADLYNNLGIAYSILNDTNKAMQAFDQAITVDPYYFEVYVNRGNLYLQLKNYEAAENDFLKVLKEYPNQQSTRYLLAKCYLEQDEEEMAKATLDQIAQNTLLAGQVGERLLSEGYPKLSIHYYTIAIGNESIRDKSYYQRATAYKQMKEYQNAIDDLLVIVETLPGPQLFFEIANLYLELNDLESSCKFWKEAADRGHKPAAELLEKNC